MGRYYYQKKTTVEECKYIDVFWLRKHNYFCGFKSGGIKWTQGWNKKESSVSFLVDVLDEQPYIKFHYTITDRNTGDKEDFDYKAAITSTECNYGNKRYWFICPIVRNNIPCRRRVAKLYLGDNKYFACRHCLDLSYDSRNKNRHGYYGYLTELFASEKEREKLNEEIKIKYRKGIPTKKYRKLLKIYAQFSDEDMAAAYADLNRRLASK